MTPQQICDKFHAIHKSIYEWFDIDFDRSAGGAICTTGGRRGRREMIPRAGCCIVSPKLRRPFSPPTPQTLPNPFPHSQVWTHSQPVADGDLSVRFPIS